MKLNRYFLIILLVVCLSFGTFMLAACKDTDTATLKLDVGQGGTLQQTELEVEVGANLADVVKDIAPATVQGVTFEGWFKDGVVLSAEDTMPEEGLTLTARYKTNYTVRAFRSDGQGNYPTEPFATESGTGYLGEPLAIDVSAYAAYGTLDSARSTTSVDKLAANQVFNVYFAGETVRINLNVNRSGESATMAGIDVVRGDVVTLPDGNDFGLDSSLRFEGWSTKADGQVEYAVGDQYDTILMGAGKYSVTMYAVWQQAATDVFGGGDYLFVSSVDNGTVYLRRKGLDEKTGTIDAATGVFSFKEGDSTILEGKIVGNQFYYFQKLAEQDITNGSANGEKIVFHEGNSITLHNYKPQGATEGKNVNGTFDIDFLTGEYVFNSAEVSFHFTVNIQTDAEGNRSLVFNRPSDPDAAGFYLYKDSSGNSNVLYLDGMIDANGIGGAMLYSIVDGKLTATMAAYYYDYEDLVYMNDGTMKDVYLFDQETFMLITPSSQAMFLFRLTEGKQDAIDGQAIKGTYQVSDGYNGHYFGDAMDEEPDLLLDGFGNAKIKQNSGYANGTYAAKTKVLQMEEYGEYYNWTDSWIELTVGNATTVERLVDNILPLHSKVDHAPQMIKWASTNPVSKVYAGATNVVNVWIYDSTVVGAYILAEHSDAAHGTYYETLDRGEITVVDAANKLYKFQSNLYTDVTNFWEFRYVGNDVETTVPGAESFTATDAKGVTLAVDKWGTLTYNNVQYNFDKWQLTAMSANIYGDSKDGFYLEFYHFTPEGTKEETVINVYVAVHVEDDDSLQYTRSIVEKAPVDIIWKQFYGQDDYFDKFYMLDATTGAIGMLSSDGSHSFTMYGTVAYDDTAKEYSFDIDNDMLDDYISVIGEQNREYVESYAHFKFKYAQDNSAIIKYIYQLEATGSDGTQFKADGYGNATYIPKGGQPIEGSYETIDYYSKYYFEFTSSDGKEHHFISVLYDAEDNPNEVLVDTDEGGVYYLIDSDGYIYLNDYIVLLGDRVSPAEGTQGKAGTVVYGSYMGTYQKTDTKVSYFDIEYTWTEYHLVLDTVDPETHKPTKTERNIITSTVEFGPDQEHLTARRCFVERMDPQAGRDFVVLDSDGTEIGTIHGDGYNDSEFHYGDVVYFGLIGIGVIKDQVSPLQIDYDWDDDWEHGKQVIFRSTYYITNSAAYLATNEFLFDIGTDGKIVLRDSLNATYGLYENGNITQNTMYLDGHGHATLKDEQDRVIETGTYTEIPSLDCFLYTPDNKDNTPFRFGLAGMSFAEDMWYVYYRMEDERIYVADDWSVLALGSIREDDQFGYINGLYIDARGNVSGGFYSQLADDVVRFDFGDGTYGFYDITADSFVVNSDRFIIRNGTLVAYQGPSIITDLVIPDGVTAIGANAFANVYRLGGKAYEFDLNDVERIEDYAFFGVHEFSVPTIQSDKVTYVGNYAFYSPYSLVGLATEDLPFSWLVNVNLPNATYIGNYAFNGCNQMNTGVVYLEKVEFIGYSAFSHNVFPDEDDKMKLDLTYADVSKISMDRNAFLPGPNTDLPGLPVVIWVRDDAAKQATSKWYQAIRDCVVVKASSVQGLGYFDFASGDYLEFGALNGNNGVVSYYTYDKGNYTLSTSTASYAPTDEYGVVQLTVGGAKVNVDVRDVSIKVGNKTFLRNGDTHKFEVTDEDGKKVNFMISFNVSAQVDVMGASVEFTVNTAIYDGHIAASARVDLADYTCGFSYSEGDDIFNVVVNMHNWTSSRIPYGITVYSADGNYRADLSYPYGDSYLYMDLYALDRGGEYDLLVNSGRFVDKDVWTGSASDSTAVYNYTVTYNASTNQIEVEVAILFLLPITTEDGEYRVTFEYTAASQDKMVGVYSFERRVSGDTYEYIINPRDPIYGVRVSSTDRLNKFEIVSGTPQNQDKWTVVYTPAADGKAATVTVELVRSFVITVQSDHQDGENYIEVRVLADSTGAILNIGDEFTVYTRTSGGYDHFSYMIRQDSIKNLGNNTFEFSDFSGQHVYTVTFTVTGEGDNRKYSCTYTVK